MKQQRGITIRVSILTTMLVMLLLVNFSVNLIARFYMDRELTHLARDMIAANAATVAAELNEYLRPSKAYQLAASNLFATEVIDMEDTAEIENLVYYLASITPHAAAVYWTDPAGNAVTTERLANGALRNHRLQRTAESSRVTYYDLDARGHIVNADLAEKGDPNLAFKPEQRPWYQAAIKAQTEVWTDVYQFFPELELGVTNAVPIYTGNQKLLGVLASDIELASLSQLLTNGYLTKNSKALILDRHDNVLAYSDGVVEELKSVSQLQQPWLAKAYEHYQASRDNYFEFALDGHEYIVAFYPLGELAQHSWKIMMVIPKYDLLAGIIDANMTINMVSFAMLFVGLLLAILLANWISRPIKTLAAYTNKVKDFELGQPPEIHTHLKEVDLMQQATQAMVAGLRSFKKYVPADLVRQVIAAGEDTKLGGSYRNMAVMFADIQGFTAMVEQYGADVMLEQLTEFFDVFTRVIRETHGAVDKYIGDEVMAFWGAPTADSDYIDHACAAALACQEKLQELNKAWSASSKNIFTVRIGLTAGNMVVGNIGASERMNYSVIGDAVNLASRLQHLNTEYNTSILVNEAVAELAQSSYVFRFIDEVKVAGRNESVRIFELVSKQGD